MMLMQVSQYLLDFITVGNTNSAAHGESRLPNFYDFFAGAGMATLGLSQRWDCVWANDIDQRKAKVYTDYFGAAHFVCDDVANITAAELPRPSHLAWASFPCQDLSLAGWQRGLSAERSGAFWPFWRIMHDLLKARQRPPIIVIENVVGLLHGDSFLGLCEALAALDMQFGALVMDARKFLPQSRPRVFVVAVDSALNVSAFVGKHPVKAWTPNYLAKAQERLPDNLKAQWRWWKVVTPRGRIMPLNTIIEETPTSVAWHTVTETQNLLAMMDDRNRGKVDKAILAGGDHIGFLYKRIRKEVQRAEVRFDGVAGCLRTPKGGSSRQTVVIVNNGQVRSRLLSPREAARLMGVPENFNLPTNYNDAYRAMGDGVAVPVVSWLSEKLLFPLAEQCLAAGGETVDLVEQTDLSHLLEHRLSSERRAGEWLMSQKLRSVQ